MYSRIDIDFWSAMVEMSVEEKIRFETMLEDMKEKWSGPYTNGDKPFGFKITPWRSKDYQLGYWLVSLWGTGSGNVAVYHPCLHNNVTRVDLRRTFIDSFANFSTISDVTLDAYKGRKNVTRYNNKPRLKTETRDRGGCGFAVGSLKSENRLSVYLPGLAKELAMEVQFRGKKAIEVASELLAVQAEATELIMTGRAGDATCTGIADAVWEICAEPLCEEGLGTDSETWATQAHAISRDSALRIAEHHMRLASQFLEPDQQELPL